MNLESIERRRETRRMAQGPILFQIDGFDDSVPGHLVDLSKCGAGVLTTDGNAPVIGEHIELEYEDRSTDEDGTNDCREKAIVVNIRHPERGISRIGLRFLQPNGEGCMIGEPPSVLDTSKMDGGSGYSNRVEALWSVAAAYETVGAN